MERTTRKQMEKMVDRINELQGRSREAYRKERDEAGRLICNRDCLVLDSMNPGDGRTFAIETAGGARPFWNGRLKGKEMAILLRGIVAALEDQATRLH